MSTNEQENIDLWRRLEIPFARRMGIDVAHMADGRAEMRYAPVPDHFNSFGMIHGGALMTLLDIALAGAARSVDVERGVVTIEMKTSFLRPAQGVVTGHGRLIHRTGSMAFVEGTVEDAEGRVCAHATGTFKYVPRPAATDR